MKILFYIFSIISIVIIAVGVVQFDNFRDRLYLLAMLIMFLAIATGLAAIIQLHKQ